MGGRGGGREKVSNSDSEQGKGKEEKSDVERGVSMVVEESDIYPVLEAYKPVRVFLGLFIQMINKIGGI